MLQLESTARTDARIQLTTGHPVFSLRKDGPQRRLDQLGVVRGRQSVRGPLAVGVYHSRIKLDFKMDKGMPKRPIPVADDRREQDHQKPDADEYGKQPVEPEQPLRAVTTPQAGVHPASGFFGSERGHQSYCSR